MFFKKLDTQVTCLSKTLKEILEMLQQEKKSTPLSSFTKKTRPGPKPKVRSPPDFSHIELKHTFEKG